MRMCATGSREMRSRWLSRCRHVIRREAGTVEVDRSGDSADPSLRLVWAVRLKFQMQDAASSSARQRSLASLSEMKNNEEGTSIKVALLERRTALTIAVRRHRT